MKENAQANKSMGTYLRSRSAPPLRRRVDDRLGPRPLEPPKYHPMVLEAAKTHGKPIIVPNFLLPGRGDARGRSGLADPGAVTHDGSSALCRDGAVQLRPPRPKTQYGVAYHESTEAVNINRLQSAVPSDQGTQKAKDNSAHHNMAQNASYCPYMSETDSPLPPESPKLRRKLGLQRLR